MIAPLAKFIDWSVIQATTLREPPADGRNPRLEEALQFLKGPDFIPEESQPARVEFYPDQSMNFARGAIMRWSYAGFPQWSFRPDA